MKNRLLGTAVSVVSAVGFVFVGSSNAEADMTLYRLKDFEGGYYVTSGQPGPLADKSWFFESGSIDNAISSFDNHGAEDWNMYDAASCTGTHYYVQSYSEDKDLSSNSGNPSNFDNKASCIL